jgi:hypothetical protein
VRTHGRDTAGTPVAAQEAKCLILQALIQNLCGIPPEILQEITAEFRKAQRDLGDGNEVLRELNDAQKGRVDELRNALALSDGQFRTAFEAFGETGIPPDQQLTRLIQIAARWKGDAGAEIYEAQIPGARALVDRLRSR